MQSEITALRGVYHQHVQTYIVDPRRTEKELDPSINNPLSQDEEVRTIEHLFGYSQHRHEMRTNNKLHVTTNTRVNAGNL